MSVTYSDNFVLRLKDIVEFIAKDSKARALEFAKNIRGQINSLVFMPKRCRKNFIANDENIRDLIFKGYVIVFEILPDEIRVLDIYKENLPKF